MAVIPIGLALDCHRICNGEQEDNCWDGKCEKLLGMDSYIIALCLDFLRAFSAEYTLCRGIVCCCLYMAVARASAVVSQVQNLQHTLLCNPRLFQEDSEAVVWLGEWTYAVCRHNHFLLLGFRGNHEDEGNEGIRMAEVFVLNEIFKNMIKSILVSSICSTNRHAIEQIFETKGKVYTFLNPVSYLTALDNKELFGKMDGIFADGGLLVKAIKLVYGKLVTRRSFDMTSMAPELFSYAEEHGKTIYIVASKQEQVEKAVEIFRERYPKAKFAGYRNGYFASEQEMDEEAKHIVKLNSDFLIVGMGALMQEKFLLKVKNASYQGVGFTCGGFIHQTSKNEIDYYPAWVDKTNLRFVYRMWKEPHTRKRYMMAGLLFPVRFIAEKIFG